MSTDKKYNGWTNYETWAVNLWMGNEQSSSAYWDDQAREAWVAAEAPSANARMTGSEPFTREERATMGLASVMQEEFETGKANLLEKAEAESTVWADLLGAALSEVNWHEIAKHYIEDVDKTEEEEATEEA